MKNKQVGEKQAMPWAEWLELIHLVEKKGVSCEEWNAFAQAEPEDLGAGSDHLIEKELAKLETALLEKCIKKLQSSMNQSLEEGDLFFLEKGIRDFKREVAACFFFQRLEGYPLTVKKSMGEQITKILYGFLDEFMGYVKKIDENGTNDFLEDVIYLCRKAKLKNYVGEFDQYG